jgi:TPR repeat protein
LSAGDIKVSSKMKPVLCLVLAAGVLCACSESKKEADSNPAAKPEAHLDPFQATKAKADQGDAQAQFEIGSFYQSGTGTAKNLPEAIKWYRKSSEQGVVKAQSILGLCYGEGTGVEKDPVEAVKWYRRAAEQGNAVAQTSLGTAYFVGNGVPKDPVEAYAWFSVAAGHGYEVGAQKRELLANLLRPEVVEAAKIRALKLAAQLNPATANNRQSVGAVSDVKPR